MIGIIITLFIIISAIELYAVKIDNQKLRYFSKPLLMPLLIWIYIVGTLNIDYVLVTGLIFCLFGDIFMLGSKNKIIYFISGLSSFLVGLVIYTIIFTQSSGWLTNLPLFYYLFLVPYSAGASIFYKILKPELNAMRLPVIVYICVLVCMSFAALTRGHVYSGTEFWLPFAGSILFITSDMIIAYDQFLGKEKTSRVSIMFTYISAQVLIVSGLMN